MDEAITQIRITRQSRRGFRGKTINPPAWTERQSRNLQLSKPREDIPEAHSTTIVMVICRCLKYPGPTFLTKVRAINPGHHRWAVFLMGNARCQRDMFSAWEACWYSTCWELNLNIPESS